MTKKKKRKARAPEIKKYRVAVVRIGYGFKDLDIEATSKKRAREIALDVAGNYEYSEKTADYKVDYVAEVKP